MDPVFIVLPVLFFIGYSIYIAATAFQFGYKLGEESKKTQEQTQ